MVKSHDTRPGVVQSLKSLWAGLLEGLHDRAQLLAIELEQEKHRLLVDLLVVLALSFCAFMTFVSLNVVLFVVFWEDRLALSLVLCGSYAVATAVLVFVVRWRRRHAPRPLQSTIEELRKDRSSVLAER